MSGIISCAVYVQSDAHLPWVGWNRDPEEILIGTMELSTTDGAEERIESLDKKVRQLDALVRGLLNELLDLKTVYAKMAAYPGYSRSQEPEETPAAPAAVAGDGSTLVRPKTGRPVVLPDAVKEPAMVRIMQADGTMKMEPRLGDPSMTGSSAGYGHDMKNNPLKKKPVR